MKLIDYLEFKSNRLADEKKLTKINEYLNNSNIEDFEKKRIVDINRYFESELNEGLFARMLGGLTGLALGKAVGKLLVKVLQLQEGTVLYKIFTSRLFFMAVGAAMGKSNKVTNNPKV